MKIYRNPFNDRAREGFEFWPKTRPKPTLCKFGKTKADKLSAGKPIWTCDRINSPLRVAMWQVFDGKNVTTFNYAHILKLSHNTCYTLLLLLPPPQIQVLYIVKYINLISLVFPQSDSLKKTHFRVKITMNIKSFTFFWQIESFEFQTANTEWDRTNQWWAWEMPSGRRLILCCRNITELIDNCIN